jgi:1,4-dihydroxy-2-naphthoyl-CoA hydrolase
VLKIDRNSSLEEINSINSKTMMGALGIEYTEAGQGIVCAKMPVDHRTMQPNNIIHGGASIALAETVAGLGSVLLVDPQEFEIRGSSVSANHVGTAKLGWVYARGEILHQGQKNTCLEY